MIEGLLVAALVGLLINLRSTGLALSIVALTSAAALAIGGVLVGADFWRIVAAIVIVVIALEFGYMLVPAVQTLLYGGRSAAERTKLKSHRERQSDL